MNTADSQLGLTDQQLKKVKELIISNIKYNNNKKEKKHYHPMMLVFTMRKHENHFDVKYKKFFVPVYKILKKRHVLRYYHARLIYYNPQYDVKFGVAKLAHVVDKEKEFQNRVTTVKRMISINYKKMLYYKDRASESLFDTKDTDRYNKHKEKHDNYNKELLELYEEGKSKKLLNTLEFKSEIYEKL